MSDNNFWVNAFTDLSAADQIKAAATMRAARISGLAKYKTETAVRMLVTALEEIYVVDQQSENIIRILLGRGEAHARARYSTEGAVLTRLYNPPPKDASASVPLNPPCLLSGFAGSGKSSIVSALSRSLPPQMCDLGGGKHKLSHRPVRVLRVGTNATLRSILKELVPDEHRSVSGRLTLERLKEQLPQWLDAEGTCLILVDEMQFLTGSEKANVQITQAIMAIAELGVPWGIACNYSLLNRLAKRSSEDQARVLGQRFFLHPEAPTSGDWVAFLNECNNAMLEILAFRLADFKQELWAMCAGLRRYHVQLAALAYRNTRLMDRTKMSFEDFKAAYNSNDYWTQRDDVGYILANAAGNSLAKRPSGRKADDLECTLPGARIFTDEYEMSAKQQLINSGARAAERATLTCNERALLEKAARKKMANTKSVTSNANPPDKTTGKPRLKRDAASLRYASTQL